MFLFLQLRNQIRREEHEYKLNFYNNLMDKPDSKTFFRLIRKNKASSNETAAMVIKGDQNQDVSPAYLKCSAVSVHPSEVLPVFNFPMER
jgi:hypothetical protein